MEKEELPYITCSFNVWEMILLIYPIRKIADYIGIGVYLYIEHHIKIGEIDDLLYRPKFIQNCADEQIDIVLSEHAHGGQFRLLVISKLVAPNQGVLPTYTAGYMKTKYVYGSE